MTLSPSAVIIGSMLEKRIEKLSLEPLLDNWSKGFLESILNCHKRYGSLSDKQLASFERIESRFSPQEKIKLARWHEEYQQVHKEQAKVIAKYYSPKQYFSTIVGRILTEPEYVPPRAQFKKMIENKYSSGVWEAWTSKPKFCDGTLVQIRSNHKDRNKLCMVLNSTQPIVSHAKGSKSYLILLFGHAGPIILEERHLMKPNKRGKYQ